ncbi:MAG: aminotransferase class I/II-fold pyridoxal phosphate-dependent enzyme [Actinobacteria bacterium]|nr:MAG: aminotransferase class I/II-fold pyridoxal phosphate-dependent enzyme [Actinomycetota bacterium]
MRPFADFGSYDAASTAEIARRAGVRPEQVVRFDGNTSPRRPASARPEALADELGRIHTYPHGGYPELVEAIAAYVGVAPDNIVLGAGADDVIMLVVRSFAGTGDRVEIANEPTYPLFRIAAGLAGADADGGSQTALTICCRPNNPTGELGELPSARPLVVDEAYFEYSGVTALDLLDEDVVLVRTFSKAFGLAGARVGYAVARRELADELNRRQAPAPVSTLSAALALAALDAPPDVAPVVEERERFSGELRALGLEPLESRANFVAVPLADGAALAEKLLLRGMPVRPYRDGIRITIRDRDDDDLLLTALGGLLGDERT